MIGRLLDMLLRLTLSPRGTPLAAWLTGCLLLALPLFALVACTDDISQEEQSQTQRQQEQIQEEDDPNLEPAPSQGDAEVEQPQGVRTTEAPDQQQEDQPRSSAADAMQRDQQESQQQTQSYGADDPYGEGDSDAQDDQPITPVPPVRQWLAEGIALAPSVPAESDEYGWSAVIEGDVIAVSAPYHDELGEDTGAVFIFERIDGEWIETAYLLPPYPDPLGWFGRWLAIDDGRIVIGAPYEDGLREDGSRIDDSGVAYVYEKVNGEWTRTGTLLPQTRHSASLSS